MDKSKYQVTPINHYSMCNTPTIFDEESLTALELVGRLTAKMVEFSNEFNEMIADLCDIENAHDKQIVEMWERINADLLGVAEQAIDELIANGKLSEELVNGFNDLYTRDKAKCWAFATVADMKAMQFISPGDTVITKGYYSSGDGGEAVYHIRAATAQDTNNGGSIILFNNLAAELVNNGRVSVKQFGAMGDGVTDDTAAVMAAATYAAEHDLILCSDSASYKTADTCTISMVNHIEFEGYFTHLNLRHSAGNGFHKVVKIRRADTLIIRDFKRAHFDIGHALRVDIIADTNDTANSAFAYNYFTGGTIDNLTLAGTGDGWINENVFDQIRLVNVAIDGDYSHNNNRFYDVTLEGGTITLGNCNSNYFTVRGENGPIVTSTPESINNIVKRTWCSTNAAYLYEFPSHNGSVLTTHTFYDELRVFDLARFDMWNMPFTNGVNANTGEALFGSWQKYGAVRVEMNDQQMSFRVLAPKCRAEVAFYDENGGKVRMDEYFISPSMKWEEGNDVYGIGANVDFAYFTVRPGNANAKYFTITATNGNMDITTPGARIECLAAQSPAYAVLGDRKPTSRSRPTQTENVPLGFEVMNSVGGSNVWGWRFNGTEWVDVFYSVAQSTEV